MKKLTVKSISEKYGVPARKVIETLLEQGIKPNASGSFSTEDAELVEGFCEDLFGNGTPEKKSEDATPSAGGNAVTVSAPVIVKNLAEALGRKPNEVISELMKLGELASINQAISDASAKKIAGAFGVELEIGKGAAASSSAPATDAIDFDKEEPDDPKKLKGRAPVVTFLGHVDHGKTSLQDAIRHTDVVKGEAGRITQHIGASTVTYKKQMITFIDTPGHEAFTSMRARGADATDIAILVVAANEGFKQQTVEAMNHAKAANVPIIVAMNKIDLPDADPNKIYLHMQQNELMSEEWGGDVGTVPVSAKTGEGLDALLARILLEAEMLELKANPDKKARGVVLEAQMEAGLGPTASVLIQSGTLKMGDAVLCGDCHGKIKTIFSDKGARIKSAGPSVPVRIVGLSGIPSAGAKLVVCNNEKEARLEAERRIAAQRETQLASNNVTNAEDLFSRLNSQEHKTLNLLIKSDVKGSGEAIAQSLAKLPSEKISANVVMNGVGAITENDVMLASASGAILIGFHVRVNPGVNELAKKQNVDIRLYSIIYELLEDITDALTGKLEPERKTREVAKAKILQIFELTKGPKVCGCMVESGTVKVGAKARVYRDAELIYNGSVQSLRRFQDDVKEVKVGLECGIRLDNFNDFVPGDIIEIYEVELKKATL